MGHRLAVGDLNGHSLLACVKCGAWATSKPRGLSEACPGVASVAGKHALKLLSKGLHPVLKTPVVSLWSVETATRVVLEEEPEDSPGLEVQGGPSPLTAGMRIAAVRARVLARLTGQAPLG